MTNVTEFSAVILSNGDQRTVAVLSGRGRPCLAVTIFRAGRVVTRSLFHEPALPVIERALTGAHGPDPERCDAGVVDQGEVRLRVWSLPGSVWYRRFDRAGEAISGCSRFVGAELDALARAAEYLRRLVATEAEELR